MSKKLVVIGIDGASWDFLQPWIDREKLPFLKRLQKQSCWGTSKPVHPISSNLLWKCYSTGKNPGKLGIFGWTNVEKKNKRIVFTNSSSFKSRELKDWLEEKGIKTGNRLSDWLLEIETSITDSEQGRTKIENHIRAKFALAKQRLSSVGFLQVIVFCTDTIMHFHWNSELMLFAFQVIDREMEKLYSEIGQDTLFVVMSDHGFQKLQTRLETNTWLEMNGYLVLKKNKYVFLHRLRINRDTLARTLHKLGLLELAKRILPVKVRHKLCSAHGVVAGVEKTEVIDWQKTIAFSDSENCIYVLVEDKAEYEKQRQKICAGLLELRQPNGKRVVEKVFKKEQLFFGDCMENAPDLIVQPVDEIEAIGNIGSKKVFGDLGSWKAFHSPRAIYMLSGKGVKKGKGKDVSILDFAPTILHYFGIAVPSDVDGKPMKFAFEHGSDFAKRKERRTEAKPETGIEERGEPDEEIEAALRKLGYLR